MMSRNFSTFARRRMAVALDSIWLATALCVVPAVAQADCVTGGTPDSYTCTDNSEVAGTQIGTTTLDATANPAILNVMTGAALSNDPLAATTGVHATVQTSGSSAITINNDGLPLSSDPNTGLISSAINMDRSGAAFDPSGWSSDASGSLLNGGVPAGVAAGLYAGPGSGPMTYNGLAGSIIATGDFSAAVFGNATRQTYNLTGNLPLNIVSGIWNQSYSYATGDTLAEGHWAIANYAGATFTPPVVQDGTQYATNVSAGSTTMYLGEGGMIIGDILMVDRNPLYMAAERADPALVLAYGASEVGPRDSVIFLDGRNNASPSVTGNFYFGSGEHTLTNYYAYVTGNIYVDQRDTAVTNVVGGVATQQYLVNGNKKFTLNHDGAWQGNLEINDTPGATNTVNVYGDSYSNFVALNGVGSNTLNFYCGASYNHPICNTSNDIAGFTTVNMFGQGTSAYLRSNGGGIHVAGDINVFNARFSLLETLNASNVNISHDSTLNVDVAGVDLNANLNSTGGINLDDKTLHVTQNMALGSGSIIKSTITSVAHGNIVVDGVGTIASDATVIPTTKNITVHTGDTYTLATNTTGTPTVTNSGLVRWMLSNVAGNVVLTANTNASITLPGLTAGAANALNTINNYSGVNADFLALAGKLQNYSTDEIMTAGERLRPEINDGAFRTALGISDQVLGMVESRLFESHLADAYAMTGASAGDAPSIGASIWVRGFGFNGDQSRRANVDGYTSEVTGLVFGADRLYGNSDKLRVGGALSYARGNVNNQGITDTNQLAVNSYLATVYGSLAEESWYLNGSLGFGRQTYRSTRVPLVTMNNRGSHDGIQLSAKVESGFPVRFDEALTLVPLASFSYNRFHEDAYQESGSLTALSVGSRDTNSFRSGLGGKAIYSIQEDDWLADLEMRALWGHEFGSIDQDVIARFMAGGDTFISPGVKAARDSFLLGGSVRLSGDNEDDLVSVSLNYDAEIRPQYFGQALSMLLRYDFEQGAAYARMAEFRKAATQAREPQNVVVREKDIASISRAIAPATSAGAAGSPAELSVAAMLDAWATARANKDVDKYLNHYAADFSGIDAGNHNTWERKRKSQLSQEGRLTINISYLKIQTTGDEASAIFTHTVTEGDRKQVSRKIIDLEERNGRWQIVGENDMAVAE